MWIIQVISFCIGVGVSYIIGLIALGWMFGDSSSKSNKSSDSGFSIISFIGTVLVGAFFLFLLGTLSDGCGDNHGLIKRD